RSCSIKVLECDDDAAWFHRALTNEIRLDRLRAPVLLIEHDLRRKRVPREKPLDGHRVEVRGAFFPDHALERTNSTLERGTEAGILPPARCLSFPYRNGRADPANIRLSNLDVPSLWRGEPTLSG